MDETMEAITWRQLSIHDKPVVFVDSEGFWDGIESTFDTMHRSGFLSDRDRELVSFFSALADAVAYLADFSK
jgi:predicted Rossmann-fold nucleotide-binding protein